MSEAGQLPGGCGDAGAEQSKQPGDAGAVEPARVGGGRLGRGGGVAGGLGTVEALVGRQVAGERGFSRGLLWGGLVVGVRGRSLVA
jgi:hypothetical protein